MGSEEKKAAFAKGYSQVVVMKSQLWCQKSLVTMRLQLFGCGSRDSVPWRVSVCLFSACCGQPAVVTQCNSATGLDDVAGKDPCLGFCMSTESSAMVSKALTDVLQRIATATQKAARQRPVRPNAL